MNVRYAEARLTPTEIVERQGLRYRLTRWSDADYIFKRIVLDASYIDAQGEYVEKVSKFTLDDFRFMFGLYDMTIHAVFGDYSLAAFDKHTSPRLILVAAVSGATGSSGCGSRSRA